MKVSAVVVTYNAMKWIGKCLESLAESTFSVDIIVVDNASDDGTADFIEANFCNVRVCRMESNAGFAAAASEGSVIALSEGADAVLLMHHDVWVTPTAIEVLVNNCSDDSLLVPVYYNGPGIRCETSFAKGPIKKSRTLRKSLSDGTRNKVPVNNVPPACWFLPAGLLRSVGSLNTLFTVGNGASADYLARMKYHKKKVYVVTGALVFHDRDSMGNRTLYDKSKIYSRLVQIACDPRKGHIRRAVSRTNFFTGLLWYSMHFRVNLLSVYRNDYKRVKKLRPLLKERREISRKIPVV